MYRAFTSSGTERDVSRWLKEMGYRGQGLKKESLMPLCRGEMIDVWNALFVACRPPDVVKEMKHKVEIKLQRQATLEMRQRTQEDMEKRRNQIERIQKLRQRAEQYGIEIERLKSHVSQLANDLGKVENEAARQRVVMESRVQRSKVLAAVTGRTEEAIKSMDKEMHFLAKHNGSVRKAMQEEGEIGMADFESVMHAMYDFMNDGLSQKLRQRPMGVVLSAQEVFPRIDACPEVKDPAVSQLMTDMGRLYAHHSRRLTHFFKVAGEEALFGASQFEAKCSSCTTEPTDVTVHGPQTKVIEEMLMAGFKSFAERNRIEDANERRLAALKESPTVQKFLAAVEASECREGFNSQLDALCLESEIGVLKKEIERLAKGYSSGEEAEKEAKGLYRQVQDQVEQSHQMDLLLLHGRDQLHQLQKDFEAIAEAVKSKLEKSLPSVVSTCLESLKELQQQVGKELETYRQVDYVGIRKEASLREQDVTHSTADLPLLQRWESILTALGSTESMPYSTASLKEVCIRA